MKKYKVYDLLEGKEVLGFADTMEEINKIALEWFKDTDGECSIFFAELDNSTNKYKLSECKAVNEYDLWDQYQGNC